MSGNTNTTTNNANHTDNSRFFTGDRGEFGMHVFSDPSRQATYDFHEDGYRNKLRLKEAYDQQEILRKMRVDLKREYMTRKKQVKTLQKYAAVDFRNAEMSLQEHYASVKARSQSPFKYCQRAIDICAPLVSQITLPSGEVVDLKKFDCHAEFERIVGVHASLLQEQKDAERDEDVEDSEDDEEWFDQPERHCLTPDEWDAMVEQRLQDGTRTRTQTHNFGWVSCESPTATTTTCRSAFGGCYDYTEEELEEKRRRHQEELEEEQHRCHQEELELELQRCDQEELEEEQQRRDQEELELELQRDIEQRARELPDEPASEGNRAIPLPLVKAKKPRTATASATKARIAKQLRKHQKQEQVRRKYVPLSITINDNRADENQTEALLAMISSSKIEINLPKKNLQKASHEAKKNHTKMWHSVNAQVKQSAARGTRIDNIQPKSKYLDHDDSDCDDN